MYYAHVFVFLCLVGETGAIIIKHIHQGKWGGGVVGNVAEAAEPRRKPDKGLRRPPDQSRSTWNSAAEKNTSAGEPFHVSTVVGVGWVIERLMCRSQKKVVAMTPKRRLEPIAAW